MGARLQRVIKALYPDQCLSCGEPTEGHDALCAGCWSETRFLLGHGCDQCGAALLGVSDGVADLCDRCMAHPMPWRRGRAAIAYDGLGKRLVLSMKHGDRPAHARPFGRWMARAGRDILRDGPLLVPAPLHWTRLLTRRFNQAAELARSVAEVTGLDWCPDALRRVRRTAPLGTLGRPDRYAILSNAIAVSPHKSAVIAGQHICLIDDVLTSGATLTACTEACLAAGAREVSVLVLARAGVAP